MVKTAGLDAKMKFKPLVLVFEYGLAPGTHVKRHSAREIKLVLPLKPSSSVKASPFSHSVSNEQHWFLWRGKQNQTFLGMKKKTWRDFHLSRAGGAEGDKTKINLSVTIQGSAKRRGLGCVNSLFGSVWL